MQTWRKLLPILILVALTGPWAAERLSVPAQYACDGGFRIDDTFCGTPFPGLYVFLVLFGNVFGAFIRLLAGTAPLEEFAFTSLGLAFILLPTLSTILLAVSQGWLFRDQAGLHVGILGFGLALGILGMLTQRVQLIWQLWGIWLYLLLLASSLGLELLARWKARPAPATA